MVTDRDVAGFRTFGFLLLRGALDAGCASCPGRTTRRRGLAA
jgi:hypothetical protein